MIMIIIITIIIITIIVIIIIIVTIKGTNYKNGENPNKNMALANLSIYYTWKNIKQNTTTINLKYLLQHGMKLLIYLMVLILLLIFKITLIYHQKA